MVAVGKGRSPAAHGGVAFSSQAPTGRQRRKPITPLQGVPHVMAAHPGLRFACPGLADAGLSGQGNNRDNGEERGQLHFAEGYAEQGCPRYTRARRPRYPRQRRGTRATPLRRRLRRAGMPAIHEGETPSLRATTARTAGNSASPKATQSRDARDTRGRDALATRGNGEDHGRDGRATHDRRKTGTRILPRFCFLRQAPVTAFRAAKAVAVNIRAANTSILL
jgi:hypothetical protein